MFAIFQNRRLPLYELREVMTRLSGRIPDELEGQINEELKRYGHRLGSMLTRFPSMRILVLTHVFGDLQFLLEIYESICRQNHESRRP